ncbi:MAG TPA: ABC transporter permease [Candidatus Pristimantibacillus sp.]|nr:ABC transporter permease [Candidatus Pristimantibacillus sp.]
MSAVLRGDFRMALSGVRGSKWRSILTMFGIVVGIVAVVTMVGIGEGVKQQIAGTVDHFGKDLIVVRPKQTVDNSPAKLGQSDVVFGLSSAVNLSNGDTEQVRRTPGVKMISPLGIVPGTIDVNGQVINNAKVFSAGADAPALLSQEIAYGDFWTDKDEDAHYAVLGQKAALSIFDEPVPLGRSFTFRGESFQVRGIFASFANIPFSPTASFDDVAFIPYKTAAKLTNNSTGPYVILAKPESPDKLDGTIHAIQKQLLSTRDGQQDFTVADSRHSLNSGNGLIQLLSMWIFAVAAISLLMGGIGIMNIMLLVVTERMHEIGVRKAVGASSRQILGQFVAEATVLSVVGGIVGIILSTGSVELVRIYTDFKPVISWPAIGIAAGVSIAIGIIFGAIPAIKAARKDPIEALRHE